LKAGLYRRNPTAFIERLVDPEAGKRFKLLPAEREFLQHALATDGDGRLLYPEMIYGAIKKSGKTRFAALCSPCCCLRRPLCRSLLRGQ
jgi:hypothetical protein